jgi:hypothetical protein
MFVTVLVTIAYPVFIFTMIEQIEEGYIAHTIYYVALIVLIVVVILGTFRRQAISCSRITEYIKGINHEIFASQGVDIKFDYSWSWKCYQLNISRFKEDT